MRLIDQFSAFLDRKEWVYDKHENVFRYQFVGDDLNMEFFVYIDEKHSHIIFESYLQGSFDEQNYLEGIIACSYVNDGLDDGHFCIKKDGRVVFTTTSLIGEMIDEDDVFEMIMSQAHYTCDKYNDRFFALMKNYIDLEKFKDLVMQR